MVENYGPRDCAHLPRNIPFGRMSPGSETSSTPSRFPSAPRLSPTPQTPPESGSSFTTSPAQQSPSPHPPAASLGSPLLCHQGAPAQTHLTLSFWLRPLRPQDRDQVPGTAHKLPGSGPCPSSQRQCRAPPGHEPTCQPAGHPPLFTRPFHMLFPLFTMPFLRFSTCKSPTSP